MAAETVLEARDLTKRYGGVAAVNGMSLVVRQGEILGLIGPNGAGKTTMFDLLAGSVAPSAGAIHLMGRDISREPAHRRLAGGLARTFQIPRPFPELTLLENMLIARQGQTGERLWANFTTPRKVATEERAARDKALALLDLVALRRLADEPARVLSGGQRKLLELARVMMADPKLILLDEPAAGVNPALLEVLIKRIMEINASGVTFMLIEHNIDMVSRLCNRIVVMAQGAHLFEGRPDEVARDPRVIEAYLGGAAA
jgi:branched-chain amino acid transport system ATP-binding protein